MTTIIPTPGRAEGSAEPLAAKYGLPVDVRFCRRCVISNQRPNSSFEFRHTRDSAKTTIHMDAEGVCDACRFAEQKRQAIDWEQRQRELRELCDRYRRSDGSYDCLVPGSGGKDSFYAAHVLKYTYGMHPLTVTWAPHLYTDWGWRNHQAWIHAGFDNYLCTPNGRIHRLLTRLAVQNLFHPFQPFIIGQKALAPKMAALFRIPLVFYGENEAEYGNPLEDTSSSLRKSEYYTALSPDDIHLSGVSLRELEGRYGIDRAELKPYLPADPDALDALDVKVHYLGYYLRWHPQSAYYYAVEHGGFQASPERTPGTYSKYNSIDDRIDDFHYWTTYVKFGIGRATYDASQEIRSGDITRDEGVALVRRFDGEWPERFAEQIFEYLSIGLQQFPVAAGELECPIMTREYFLSLADEFRSPHLWRRDGDEWRLRHTVWNDGGSNGEGAGRP
ncbi:MAG: N-acetyl sugar amidotransferase [Gemmatimonadaceae bacterium]